MQLDLWSLYELMLGSRHFEQAVMDLWRKGRISGEMYLDRFQRIGDRFEIGDLDRDLIGQGGWVTYTGKRNRDLEATVAELLAELEG